MKRMSGTRLKHRNDRAAKSPWPFVVMAVGAVLIVAVGFLAWRGSRSPQTTTSPTSTGSTRLSVDRSTIDLGKVPLDVPVKATFKLKNVGDQPLTIKGEPRVELVKGC
jgi:hypothetical protein